MTVTSILGSSLLEVARTLAPRIRASGDEIEEQRELPRPLFEALADAGLFRMLVPRSLGGAELELPTYIQIVEEIGKADASTAWCVNQGAVFATNSARLSEDAAREIWGRNPRAVVANGPAPSAQATAVEGGYRVTGHWTFSSGCRHASYLAGFTTIVENGRPRRGADGKLDTRYMLFPAEQAEIIDAWQVRGLRGTGSHHFAVSDLFVPRERTVWSVTDPPREPGPLYVFPTVLLFACGFASVAIGTARSALDDLIELAGGKTPRGTKGVLRDQALVQSQVGHAEAHLRAGRALLHETVREVWESVRGAGAITLEQRVALRLATTHAIRLAEQVVDLVYNAAGATAIYQSSPIQRRFQDMHVITQHIQGRLAHYESVGRFVLGLDPDFLWL